MFDGDACLGKQMLGEFVGIRIFVDDARDAGIYYHLGAYRAGLVRAVKRRAVHLNAEFSRLDYGVLFGMDSIAHFVARTAGNAEFVTHTFALVAAIENA